MTSEACVLSSGYHKQWFPLESLLIPDNEVSSAHEEIRSRDVSFAFDLGKSSAFKTVLDAQLSLILAII